MGAKTLEALKGSIAKWERNSRVRNPENFLLGRTDCPLCNLFWKGGCERCPVFERGHFQCEETPFDEACKGHDFWDRDNGKSARTAAREEVAFLKSLLPESERDKP